MSERTVEPMASEFEAASAPTVGTAPAVVPAPSASEVES